MWVLTFLLITLSVTCNGYRFLVAFPMPTRSHSILGDGIVNVLAKANHKVTYITPFPKNKPLANIREIDISENLNLFPDDVSNIQAIMDKKKDIHNLTEIVTIMAEVNSKTIEHPTVHKLLHDPKEEFDVIIVEWLFYELLAGLSAVFNCPFIWLSPTDPHSKILKLVDDIANPAYNPDVISSNYPPFSFIQRVKELAFMFVGLGLEHFTLNPIQFKAYENLLVPIIQKRGNKVPLFEDVMYNGSLILSNSHYSVGRSLRLPQNVIPIGGYHISREVKPLPDNLKKLLDNAKNGLIYFSMGSNLKSRLMPEELKKSLLKMFGTLKYTVLWKFEENLPGTPSNVHIVQWAPQPSILAHPNCVLFVTHGGLLSTTETIHFGKPIVAIPVFADQFNNANNAVRKGFGIKVDLSYTMADNLKVAIEGVIQNPKYAARAKELSMIYHDRPVTPDKEMVHWVEHVVKTRGAPHLRSPALDLSWYQKLYLDLFGLLIILKVLLYYICKKIVRLFLNDKTKVSKKKRQ
ncbi:UDP-glucosyltransferase 2-like [Pieris napi]|uniref:UDP-glucosyltransferase 2-like n=1 Tax=Pieris napi TaxID=78633 RepID=UPI001FB861FB|nr:UDP-glucosyltransferase 2-like [Pieris napi]